MTRYLIITDFQPGIAGTPIEDWSPDEITAHLDYYRAIQTGLPALAGKASVYVVTDTDVPVATETLASLRHVAEAVHLEAWDSERQ